MSNPHQNGKRYLSKWSIMPLITLKLKLFNLFLYDKEETKRQCVKECQPLWKCHISIKCFSALVQHILKSLKLAVCFSFNFAVTISTMLTMLYEWSKLKECENKTKGNIHCHQIFTQIEPYEEGKVGRKTASFSYDKRVTTTPISIPKNIPLHKTLFFF